MHVLHRPVEPAGFIVTKAVRTRVRPVNIRQSISGLSWVWALEALGATTDSSALPSRGGSPLPWCTTPIEAESSLGPDSHHPVISLSGIPSAVMVLRILHPILASTLCAANPLARIAEPTIAL